VELVVADEGELPDVLAMHGTGGLARDVGQPCELWRELGRPPRSSIASELTPSLDLRQSALHCPAGDVWTPSLAGADRVLMRVIRRTGPQSVPRLQVKRGAPLVPSTLRGPA
jgi:hypothetical protein